MMEGKTGVCRDNALVQTAAIAKTCLATGAIKKKTPNLARTFSCSGKSRKSSLASTCPRRTSRPLEKVSPGVSASRSSQLPSGGGSSSMRSVFCLQDDYFEKSLHINIFLARTLAVLWKNSSLILISLRPEVIFIGKIPPTSYSIYSLFWPLCVAKVNLVKLKYRLVHKYIYTKI
jgi:hypothetical protein